MKKLKCLLLSVLLSLGLSGMTAVAAQAETSIDVPAQRVLYGANGTNISDVSFNYATNPEKTEQQHYITALNCFKETAKEEMKITKEQYGKLGGIVAFHLVQSFKENEVSPEIAHEIGVRLAEEIFGERKK